MEKIFIAEATGDFEEAISDAPDVQPLADYDEAHFCAPIMMSADLARAHDVAGSLAADRGANDESEAIRQQNAVSPWYEPPLPKLMRAVALSDWRGVRDDLVADEALPDAAKPAVKPFFPVVSWPWLAYADARLGDFATAETLIGKTPGDCYLCVEMRGNIRSAEKNWPAAGFWFADAVKQAPSIPFAYTDWGAMLLAKGDYDGAIEKHKEANLKGPHFADPLEMWGEALMRRNRSDLALAKFEEAEKYAPNWGRLHLKWGEALFCAGRRDEAKKQLAIASGLELSQSDKAELAKAIAVHG
jgi:hypothetical protein